MATNCRSTLGRRRVARSPMADFDRLPPAARRWLAAAVLPWSARSVARVWHKALHESGGDENAALAYLDRVEQARLASETARIWGPLHPVFAGRAGA